MRDANAPSISIWSCPERALTCNRKFSSQKSTNTGASTSKSLVTSRIANEVRTAPRCAVYHFFDELAIFSVKPSLNSSLLECFLLLHVIGSSHLQRQVASSLSDCSEFPTVRYLQLVICQLGPSVHQ